MQETLKPERVNEIREIYQRAKKLSEELIQTGEDNSLTAITLTTATLSLRNAYKEAEYESKQRK